MKRLIQLSLWALLFSSCMQGAKPLYYWGNYEKNSYKMVKGREEEDLNKLMETYKDIVENASTKSQRGIPPGVCADYGFFLLSQGKNEEGRRWLDQEKILFPESAVFIDRILKTMKQ
ncbi:MAG: DUF4810 domain-containing protein [Cyclobacteriaceae bacterium]|jgi:hypothetical protein|nr:DUF4810 domain-containing protein [Cyclobacteriaceae bacterium]